MKYEPLHHCMRVLSAGCVMAASPSDSLILLGTGGDRASPCMMNAMLGMY